MDSSPLVREMEEVLRIEPGSLQASDRLHDLQAWDSMAALSLIALVDERYGVTLDANRLAQCETVADVLRMNEPKASQ